MSGRTVHTMSTSQMLLPALTRRQVLLAGGLVLGAAGINAAIPASAQSLSVQDGTRNLHPLGAPVLEVANAAGDVGTDLVGNPRIYTVSSGSGGNLGTFNVVDIDSGSSTHS